MSPKTNQLDELTFRPQLTTKLSDGASVAATPAAALSLTGSATSLRASAHYFFNYIHPQINFVQESADSCTITWDITGAGKPGLHGFHIHEKADFSNGCMSAGPHFNPTGRK